MIRPSFKLKVDDKTYNIEPTFGIHDDIEKALSKTLYQVLLDAESFSIANLFSVFSVLPCKDDFKDDELRNWIALNRNDANKQISELIIFLVLPKKQEEDVKKK